MSGKLRNIIVAFTVFTKVTCLARKIRTSLDILVILNCSGLFLIAFYPLSFSFNASSCINPDSPQLSLSFFSFRQRRFSAWYWGQTVGILWETWHSYKQLFESNFRNKFLVCLFCDGSDAPEAPNDLRCTLTKPWWETLSTFKTAISFFQSYFTKKKSVRCSGVMQECDI